MIYLNSSKLCSQLIFLYNIQTFCLNLHLPEYSQMKAFELKTSLRKQLRETLKTMDDEKIFEASKQVAEKLFSLPQYKQSRSVACFVSMPKEFNTSPIIEGIFRDGKQCFLPRVESMKESRMTMLKADSLGDIASWPRSKWGIPEPPKDGPQRPEALEEGTVDLYIVPGLAFDRRGGRMGQGAGFYDRYLARALDAGQSSLKPGGPSPRPILIGVTLDELIVEEVPRDEHDLLMDIVLAPSLPSSSS